MKLAQVYVTSFPVPPDAELYSIHRMHNHCAPELADDRALKLR